MKITLPWPPKELSPNARVHWTKKAAATMKAKTAAYMLAGQEKASFPAEGKINISITFNPPDKRRRDLDNMLASAKAQLDGLADAWGIDDSRFRMTLDIGEVFKGGKVEVVV